MNKRSIQNRIESLEGKTTDTSILAFELPNGGYVDATGSSIKDLESIILTLPPAIWSRWESQPIRLEN